MHLRLEQSIAAPAQSVWQILGPRFAEISEWSTFVKTSRALDPQEVPASMSVPPEAPVPGRETVTKAKLVEVLTASGRPFAEGQASRRFEAPVTAEFPKLTVDQFQIDDVAVEAA